MGALQEKNRVYHLMASWDLGGTMRWCDNDGLVVRDPQARECPFCGQQTRERPTLDTLIDLSNARGARVDFVRGDNENSAALHEFGGLAGLVRF
jgi:hypothetical protein